MIFWKTMEKILTENNSKMNRFCHLLCAVAMLQASAIQGQSNSEVTRVDKWVMTIDKDPALRQLVLDEQIFMEQVSDGGSLFGFYKDTALVKVRLEMIVPAGFTTNIYYFQDSNLIHGYLLEQKLVGQYDEGEWIGWDFTQEPDTAYEGNFYFSQQQLFHKQEKGEPYFSGEFNELQFLEFCEELVNLLTMQTGQ